jgi:polysaccharide pyruvyl transferase WcaK-like protein
MEKELTSSTTRSGRVRSMTVLLDKIMHLTATKSKSVSPTTRIESEQRDSVPMKICFFGHFGSPNFGNEITLQTILHHLRRRLPEAKVACVCTGPEAVRATLKIETFPSGRIFLKRWMFRNRLARLLRAVFIGIPSEFCRWYDAFKALKETDMLIIPGTGLLTDAFCLSAWGPYGLFKWTLIAKLRGCEILFVSVGAGPLYSTLGRYFVKSALSLAKFRSYRDDTSMSYLKGIGFRTNSDCVYPDLVFSLPEITEPHGDGKRASRPVVGIGVMAYAGKYSVEKPSHGIYLEYLDNLVAFAGWLLAHDYVIRLLIGEFCDRSASSEFKSLLKASLRTCDEKCIIDEPALSGEQLLPQIAATDIVVGTRFHNVLLAMVLNKPVIAISFHHKCASLMNDMGLAEYCHDINHMNASRLIEQFQGVEKNAENLKRAISDRVQRARKALDEQYKLLFETI